MSDVAGVCSAPIVRGVRARGLDPLSLVEGLELSLADLEDPRGRIPWRAFVVFAERAARMLGSETIEEIAAAATVEYAPAPIRRILPRLRDSRPLFTLAARWWGPWVFHGTRGTCEVLPDGRLREIVQILPEHAACPEFLSGIRGTLRAMPRLLGQPDALVTLEQDGRQGEFLITPPPRRARSDRSWRSAGTWFGRHLGWRASRQLRQAEYDLEELGFAREQLLESKRSALSMSARLDEQSRRLDALQQLKLILGRDGEIDALQQNIVRLVQQGLGVGGVRLSQHSGEGLPIREAALGRLAGAPAQTLPLRVAKRNIGLLELWGVGANDSLAPLHELVPWVAIALENAGSKARVAQLLRLLVEDVEDWKKMERRLEQVLARRNDPASSSPEQPASEHTNAVLSSWPVGDVEGVDLAQFLYTLAPRLRQLAGDDVELELHCADGPRLARSEANQLPSFVENLVGLLCDLGSEQIWIETRAVPERAEFGCAIAEIRVGGRGGHTDPVSSVRLLTALDLFDMGSLAADLDVLSEADGAVWARVRMPLLAPAPGRRLH